MLYNTEDSNYYTLATNELFYSGQLYVSNYCNKFKSICRDLLR